MFSRNPRRSTTLLLELSDTADPFDDDPQAAARTVTAAAAAAAVRARRMVHPFPIE
jgi:hypothetical protein